MSEKARNKRSLSPARRARSQGRELALRYLFSADLSGLDSVSSFDDFAREETMRGEAVVFARELVDGVIEHLERTDAMIVRYARNWKLERMAAVDRNVLRIGCHELLHAVDTPVAVLINEAVELAKTYGSERSGGFVNGLLDRIAKTEEAQRPRRPKSDPDAPSGDA